MNMRNIVIASLMLVCFLALSTSALAAIQIEKVEVDDEIVTTGGSNLLSVERGQDIEVSVKVSSDTRMDDVEIEAFISGYEHNRYGRISDNVGPFDMDANTSYTKRLELTVPDRVDEDAYLLRIIVSDRFGDTLVSEYKLKIDVPRHSVRVRDIILNPEGEVKAGRALLVTVRVENYGQKDEDSVRVRVSIPELGISASQYIDEVEAEPDDNTESSEELYLRIPADARPGIYTIRSELAFNDGYEKTSADTTIRVLPADEEPKTESKPTMTQPKTVIAIASSAQDVAKGEAGAIYPLTITNSGEESRAYTLVVSGTEGWADVKITPSNSIIIGPGESRALYVYVSAQPDASAGQKVFTVSVMSNGETLKQVPLSANVIEGKKGSSETSTLRRTLEVGLIVLVIVLIVLALVIGMRKSKGDDGDNEEQPTPQTYY